MTVHLIGAGPGDPELLTLRAARLLGECDVVVHDRLIDPAILDLAPASAERIDVGKIPSITPIDPPHRGATQEEINQILVNLGRRGLNVVRLKGGDPFVFGRGGEEAIALANAGIAYAVVPGVTSAISAPMAAGVPVTHRNLAPAFTVVTGHRAPGNAPVDWQALARVGGTIVVLMGVGHRGEIANELIAGGLAGDTPVCAITWATHDAQVVARTTLAKLGETAIANPATIVIGAVAALDLTSPHLAAIHQQLDERSCRAGATYRASAATAVRRP